MIFGAGYLAYKSAVSHKHNKQKKKNYERWEGLREELEEERRLSLDDRAAIFQRKERSSVDMPQRASFDGRPTYLAAPERPSQAQIEPQRTSSARSRAVAWDDELPAHLTGQRRTYNTSPATGSRLSDVTRTRSQSEEPKDQEGRRSASLERVETPEWSTPGGRMAELIESGNEPHRPAQETNSYAWLDG